MADRLDLTGQWNGTYSYPAGLGPDTPFLATLADHAGNLSGLIIERDQFHRQGTLEATIAGHRFGRAVDFTKTYCGDYIGYDVPIDYVGTLSADGLSITGVWSMHEWDGTFEMHRDSAAGEETAQVAQTGKLLPAGR